MSKLPVLIHVCVVAWGMTIAPESLGNPPQTFVRDARRFSVDVQTFINPPQSIALDIQTFINPPQSIAREAQTFINAP